MWALRRLAPVLLLLAAAAVLWFALTPQVEVMFARNLLAYRLESLAGVTPPKALPPSGTLRGVVRDARGNPLAGATVVAADATGRAYTAVSDATGRYTLALPPGETVPMATHAGYADATLAWGPLRRSVSIGDGAIAEGDFVLQPLAARTARPEGALLWGDETVAHVEQPRSADVRRRGFTFRRGGTILTGSYAYEPLAEGPYPILFFIYPCWEYPCSTIFWDVLSATMAAEGYVVVAFAPQRLLDLEADMDDILDVLARTRSGQASEKGDRSRVALLAGSLTSLHLWRAVALAPEGAVRAAVALGGVSDIFLIRQRYDAGQMTFEPQFKDALASGLIGIGKPHTNPEFYVRWSAVYHLDALARTPLALMHGGGDTTVPIEQSRHFSEQLTARDIAHRTILLPDADHYLDLRNIGAEELEMLAKVTAFLRETMGR